MHRDVKLGLALGILIIGFAAAFCFPRRPVEEIAATPVVGPTLTLVDREIRELRVRSFVGEELEPGPEPTPAAEDASDEGLEALSDAPRFEPTAPDPIPIAPPEAFAAPVVSAAPSASQSAESVTEAVDVPGVADVLTPEEERLYTVQPGDTLSRIASKLMGNAGKYTVLYEANKVILKSPSSLQPGMVLKIPMTEQQEATDNIAQRPETTADAAVLQNSIPSPQPNPIPAGPVKMASSLADEISAATGTADATARAGKFRKAGAAPFTTGVRRRDSRDE